MKQCIRYTLYFSSLGCLPAQANVGIPTITFTLPGMVIALLPIIFIEATIFSKQLNVNKIKSIKLSSFCNIGSTLLGIPAAWIIHGLIFMLLGHFYAESFGSLQNNQLMPLLFSVTIGAPWLFPPDGDNYWMVPAATLTSLVPFFFASWFTEFLILRWASKKTTSRVCMSVTRTANLISYSLLAIGVIIWLLVALLNRSYREI
jgi:hypothetical protein